MCSGAVMSRQLEITLPSLLEFRVLNIHSPLPLLLSYMMTTVTNVSKEGDYVSLLPLNFFQQISAFLRRATRALIQRRIFVDSHFSSGKTHPVDFFIAAINHTIFPSLILQNQWCSELHLNNCCLCMIFWELP